MKGTELVMSQIKRIKHLGSVLFALAIFNPSSARADVSFVTPSVGQADGRVVISTNPLASEYATIFIDQTNSELVAYFATYFFTNNVNCAPVTSIAMIDGVITRWVPRTSVVEIVGEQRLKIDNAEAMFEALFDADLLEVFLIDECNTKTAYSFDLKGYERAMRRIGID